MSNVFRRNPIAEATLLERAHATGLADRYHAAETNYVDSLVEAINADHQRRLEDARQRIRDAIDEYGERRRN